MIELRGVTKKFGTSTHALSDINLSVSEGEFIFVVGPTGSGKTTLLRLLTREVVPTTGDVIIEGENLIKIKGDKISHLRRKIGVVFQDFKLLTDRTVFENIALPLEINGLNSKDTHVKVDAMLETMDLIKQQHLFPIQLSGGEMQRVAIARAIITEPKILLADEPTGNLDPGTGWGIIKLLKDINKKNNVTIIMATHNADVVNSMEKRVVRIEGGKIIKDQKEGKYDRE